MKHFRLRQYVACLRLLRSYVRTIYNTLVEAMKVTDLSETNLARQKVEVQIKMSEEMVLEEIQCS